MVVTKDEWKKRYNEAVEESAISVIAYLFSKKAEVDTNGFYVEQ